MTHTNDAAIRARAYQLWEESGYADGSQDAHWRQAEREVAARSPAGEGSSGAVAAPATPPRGGPGRHSDGMSLHPSVLDSGPRALP